MRLSLGPQALASALALLLAIPIVALVLAPGDLTAGLGDPLVGPAFGLSLRTSTLSLALILLCGTPLAWQLSRRPPGLLDTLVQLPIVIPPAVLGVALLLAFGRQGLLPTPIAFTSWAVVIAQVLVAAPFYVQAASAAFREVDPDHILVARSLGASPARAFLQVVVPSARGALLAGAALAWARALGEFGATLLFAGNLPGTTQTMPLAIYTALEQDLDTARALSLVLAALALAILLALRWALRDSR